MNNTEYKGWLVSNNFLKRSLATVGHFFFGYFLIGLSIGLVTTIILLIAG